MKAEVSKVDNLLALLVKEVGVAFENGDCGPNFAYNFVCFSIDLTKWLNYVNNIINIGTIFKNINLAQGAVFVKNLRYSAPRLNNKY